MATGAGIGFFGIPWFRKVESWKLEWILICRLRISGAAPSHSTVIVNFVAAVRKQLRNCTCCVFSDNVRYRFRTDDGEDRVVVPDASINCRVKSRYGNSFVDAPRFVMEVGSPSTEIYDRNDKMELYRKQEIEELFDEVYLE